MAIHFKNTNIQLVEVFLQNVKAGTLAMTPDKLCAFEYDNDFLRLKMSISPFQLPLQSGVFIARRNPFEGNFGVFNDSLPDGWGSLLLDRALTENGINPYNISILDRLSIIGKSGRGALEYIPDNSQIQINDTFDLNLLANEAHNILNSHYTDGSVEHLYRYGGSSGGARPKVFVHYHHEEWLIKFKASIDPEPVGIIEYQYSLLAKKCGIEMPETRLFEDKYFGVKRFDRDNNTKYHVLSAAGLLQADYRIPSLDYSTLMLACFKITRNIEEVYKLFRLMVFNVKIKNRDDHAKNFSFMLKNNSWFLTPAYDLLPSNGFNGYHTTTVNHQGNPTDKDIFQAAENVGLKIQRVKKIFDEVNQCINEFKLNI